MCVCVCMCNRIPYTYFHFVNGLHVLLMRYPCCCHFDSLRWLDIVELDMLRSHDPPFSQHLAVVISCRLKCKGHILSGVLYVGTQHTHTHTHKLTGDFIMRFHHLSLAQPFQKEKQTENP